MYYIIILFALITEFFVAPLNFVPQLNAWLFLP